MTQQRQHFDVVHQLRAAQRLQTTDDRRNGGGVQFVITRPARPTDIAPRNTRVELISLGSRVLGDREDGGFVSTSGPRVGEVHTNALSASAGKSGYNERD